MSSNHIVDISGLSTLTNLSVLWLDENEIVVVSVLKNLIDLTVIALNSNEIVDVSELTTFEDLEVLIIYDNNILEADVNSLQLQYPEAFIVSDFSQQFRIVHKQERSVPSYKVK